MSRHISSGAGLSRRRFLSTAALLGGGLAVPGLLTACGDDGPAESGPIEVPTGPDAFKGVTVRVAVGSFMSTGVRIFKDQWEAQTGGRIEIVEIPFGDLYSKLFQAFSSRTDAYDVVIYAGGWVSGFAKAKFIRSLEDLHSRYTQNWNDVLPKVQQLTYFGDERYTVPLDGDVFMMYYRKDAFENPTARQRFRAEKGRDLTVPETWAEYLECAEFFTGWDWAGNGRPCYGVLEALKPKDVGAYVFTAHAAAYAAHPDHPGRLFFDPATMEPEIGNEGWVQALKDWTALKASGPSQMVTYGGGDQRGNFVAGNYALAIDWPDIGVLAQDQSQSIIQDKIGYAPIPGSKRLWNPADKRWEDRAEVSRAPYMGWSGWHASVTSTTKNPAAAWSVASWLDTTENALAGVTTPGTARGPYRTDHFQPDAWSTADDRFVDAADYLKVQLDSFNHPNVQFDLRIPEAGRYFEALDTAAQLALSGQSTPEQALQRCAEEWKAITDQIGKDSQQELYRTLQTGQ
ncbi:ABC transporter substrate-binding protein [Micromonospora radicis]|uniref:Extracellular solute-binding protein n=1 Tax=Micromonospora radicis TaxID=1894971 RepID=A0A418MWL4_9ACTN|nr:extracellular solute-binding protein [Micromonospora radicis]RIV39340.1 extracellular solute-binding protein [Micromonospora radicis]